MLFSAHKIFMVSILSLVGASLVGCEMRDELVFRPLIEWVSNKLDKNHPVIREVQLGSFKCFYDQTKQELLVFLADKSGKICEIRLFDFSHECLKKLVVKTKSLKLENIASAGWFGSYLKIGFAPNEIAGCFSGFEDGKEISL